jgi:hypothetical protein
MVDGNNGPKIMPIVMALIGLLLLGVFIYVCTAGGYTLAYMLHQGAGTKGGMWYTDRPTWIPESWLDWAGYPGRYKEFSESTSPNMSITKTIENVTDVKKCMLSCDKLNKTQESPACVGFVHDKTTSSCYIADAIDFVMPSTSNTLYLWNLSNSDVYSAPSLKYFKEYSSNTLSVPKFIVTPYPETNGLDGCTANCLSNVTCNGFLFVPGTNTCSPVSNMIATNLQTLAGTNSYVMNTKAGTDNTTKYWT